MSSVKVSVDEFNAFFKKEFPQAERMETLEVCEDYVCVKMHVGFADLRPGGTVSGPAMFALADVAIYVAILSKIGLVALAVTTNLNINFLRKPVADKDIVATCKLLKLGKSLAMAEVSVCSEGSDEVVAHATGTYSIPPKR